MKRMVSLILALVLVVLMLPIQESYAADPPQISLTTTGVTGYTVQDTNVKISDTVSASKVYVITLDSDSFSIYNASSENIRKATIYLILYQQEDL